MEKNNPFQMNRYPIILGILILASFVVDFAFPKNSSSNDHSASPIDSLSEEEGASPMSEANLPTRVCSWGKESLVASIASSSFWPVRRYFRAVTSDFGLRCSPFGRGRRFQFHEGIDIAARRGTPIVSSAEGVVIYAGYRGGYGRTVIIDHGFGIASLYGHASRLLVRKGDWIEQGATIALVGSSGRSTGPHLHYELHVDGIPIDPLRYIPRFFPEGGETL